MTMRALEILLMGCGVLGIVDVLFFKGIIGVVLSEWLALLTAWVTRK